MKFRRFILGAFIFGLFLYHLPYTLTSGRSLEDLQWGSPVNGLQMSVSAITANKGDVPEFQVALLNIGDHDVTLNLGSMLANGKVQLPDNISLNLTQADGKTLMCKFADKKYSFAAGRVDDYIVPLRVGSIYTLRFKLNQFSCSESREVDTKSNLGRNQLVAQLEGIEPRFVNLDMEGIKLMNFWSGKVRSNTLLVEK